jgi:hypothetical protein
MKKYPNGILTAINDLLTAAHRAEGKRNPRIVELGREEEKEIDMMACSDIRFKGKDCLHTFQRFGHIFELVDEESALRIRES